MSLLIGIHIQEVLSGAESVSAKVGERIYPLVVPVGTPSYPFICFENVGISEEDSKDGVVNDVVSVQLMVVSKSYGEAVMLAHDVRYTLEGVTAEYPRFEVKDCRLTSTSEDWIDEADAYVVTLGLSFRTEDF